MTLFKTTSSSLKKKKSQILGVFTKAQEELVALSIEHDLYHQKLYDKMSEIVEEMSAVEREVANTNKLLNQIRKFTE